MDVATKEHISNLLIKDATIRYASFQYLAEQTKEPVDWAYEVWDNLLELSKKGDNHQRTIAVQLLCNLAKSDPANRMQKDLDTVMLVTKDEKFVTARHSLMTLWKIAIVNKILQELVTDKLKKRYKECTTEKNCTLIRYDIIEVFRKIYNEVPDNKIKDTTLELIKTEEDQKYQKKYTSLWKDLINPVKRK
ncbi:hypothetical protein BH10BAC2_BH10BAC2_08610 [soil metagenome]